MALGKKTGGRKKGTPNKTTVLMKEVMTNLVNDYAKSGLMSSDFMALDPKDRLIVSEKLMNYVLPRMQATSIDVNTGDADRTIEDRLSALAKDFDE